MFVYCDNYATCNGSFKFFGTVDEQRLRAAGWHTYDGTTQGGKIHQARLCRRCASGNRNPEKGMPPLMPGEQTLIQIEVAADEPGA